MSPDQNSGRVAVITGAFIVVRATGDRSRPEAAARESSMPLTDNYMFELGRPARTSQNHAGIS
jgi:hypothetical protein